MTVVPSVDIALDAHAELGESPVWDHRSQQLHWTDILRGHVHTYDPRTGEDRFHPVPRSVGAIALHHLRGLVLAADDGFRLLDLQTGTSDLIRPVEADQPDMRMNDGKVDSTGRFWAGTMDRAGTRAAGILYRLDADGNVDIMLRGTTVSNGLGWSPDNRWFYYIDSPTRTILRYRHNPADGALVGEPTALIDTRSMTGTPDGMAIDRDGCLWICFWQGHTLRRYSAAGRLLREIPMPVSQPTSCCFGGPHLADLYITTASYGLAGQHHTEPHAGAIFHLDPGVTGQPSVPASVDIPVQGRTAQPN